MTFGGTVVVHDALVTSACYAPLAHMVLGQGRVCSTRRSAAGSRRSISPAARWSTSRRASRRWCARCISANGAGFPEGADAAAQPRPQLHRSPPVVGGLVRVQRRQCARRRRPRRPAPSSRRTFAAAAATLAWLAAEWIDAPPTRARSVRSPAPSPGSSRSRRRRDSSAPMPAILIGLVAGAGCFLMVTSVKSWFGATTMRWTPSAFTAPAARLARC